MTTLNTTERAALGTVSRTDLADFAVISKAVGDGAVPAVNRLHKAGLISARPMPRRDGTARLAYSITPAGQRALAGYAPAPSQAPMPASPAGRHSHLGYTPKPGSLVARVIAHLQAQPPGARITSREIRNHFAPGGASINTNMAAAVLHGWLHQTPGRSGYPAVYSLRDRTAHANPTAAPRITNATPGRTLYDGAELRPYEGRPGAMRAFALPSLIGGRRVARKGAV